MIKGKTKSGFNYEIPKENLNNYELIESINELDENPLVIATVVNLLLGKEQTKKLKDHIREENGIVSADKMSDEITEIFNDQKEIKK